MSRSSAAIYFCFREIVIQAEFIELMAHYLAREMESNGIQNYSQGMQVMYNMSIEFLTGDPAWGGGDNLYILDSIVTTDDKTEFTSLVNSTKAIISGIGEEISIPTLLAIETQNKSDSDLRVQWDKPVKTKSLNKLLDAMLKLVLDENYKGIWATFEGWEDEFGGKSNTELTIL